MQIFFKSREVQAADPLDRIQRRTRFLLCPVKRGGDSRQLRQSAISIDR